MGDKYEVLAYYFPNYHPDARNEAVHGAGWTEWELVQQARPRFEGHRQPRVPVWGYEDEADPAVMARKIDAAADHAIDAFLFDWFWYEDGPFLERCLEEGFVRAPNNHRLKFALMWANHTWGNIHPARMTANPLADADALYRGAVSRPAFDTMVDHVIEKYFHHPSYWKIDGCPYFSIYDTTELVEGLGGIEATASALDSFRAKTKAAGLPGLHLGLILKQVRILAGETAAVDEANLARVLNFDSGTSYVWLHHTPLPTFPETPYSYVSQKAVEYWRQAAEAFGKPYFPNVTVGWDASPRTEQSGAYANAGYPFIPTLSGATPEAFKKALVEARRFLDRRGGDQKRILTINAWNEWTEGSYLEPDSKYGTAYLEALREVF